SAAAQPSAASWRAAAAGRLPMFLLASTAAGRLPLRYLAGASVLMCFTTAAISSAGILSLYGGIFLSADPSTTTLVRSASVFDFCHAASLKLWTPDLAHIALATPSEPWHIAHLAL